MSEHVSWIEKLGIRLGLLTETPPHPESSAAGMLTSAPPPEQWDDWVEIEARGWPGRRVERRYRLIPTT